MTYEEFLQKKNVSVKPCGFESHEVNPKLFGWQTDIVHWALRKGKAAIFADCGMGKGQPYGSKVLTPKGWVEIQKLKIGDFVMARDGKPYSVKGVYPKQEIDTYRFYYSDGCNAVFDKDHLHWVQTSNERNRKKGFKVMSTEELLHCGNLRYGLNGRSRNYNIPLVEPVQFPEKTLPISPYIVGAVIGDGYLGGSMKISGLDFEIFDRINSELPDGVVLKPSYKESEWNFCTGCTGTKRHPFRQALIDMGLYGKHSYEKFIPEQYLHGSIQQRLALLHGLMDTDGCAMDGCCQYYTTSVQLKDDVVELVQGLGGIARVSAKTGIYKKNGKTITCRKSYSITVSIRTFNPFWLKRKAEKWNPNTRAVGRWIDRIEFDGKQRTVCISVSSPDSSYVTENAIVTHNTSIQLQWAKEVSEHEGKPVLVLAPLAVAQQTKREGIKFGIPVTVCRTQDDVRPGINVTNYEMIGHFDVSQFCGVVLDESSCIKHKDSKTRNQLQELFRDTHYKLCCTATPAPNDYMELGTHSEFLGVMKQTEMLATYFVHDGGETQKWRLKGHAKEHFFAWVASWACCLNSPKDIGASGEGFDLPPLRMHEIRVEADNMEKDGQMMFVCPECQTLNERRDARRKSLAQRVEAAAKIANSTEEQVLVWCDLNAESEALTKAINGAVEVKGSMSIEEKEAGMLAFTEGTARCLVSKASIAGFGCNWQHCHKEIFVGLSDSFESFYQAVRRCWRFGQTKPVDVYIIISDGEGTVRENIERKQRDAEAMMQSLVKYTKETLKADMGKTQRMTDEYKGEVDMEIPAWLTGKGA